MGHLNSHTVTIRVVVMLDLVLSRSQDLVRDAETKPPVQSPELARVWPRLWLSFWVCAHP